MSLRSYDCIVVGGGHAGTEAAYAASKMGARTLLITISRDTIAKMSCNPAIGGLAKGQIAREIDSMGGIMGLATDAAGIQFRLLNRSKGPAVQSPRAQADKYKYKDYVRQFVEAADNLDIYEGIASEVITENSRVAGVGCLDGTAFKSPSVVLTTGTFLRGLIHVGDRSYSGGRLDEPASNELSENLISLGIELQRLKTGTPCRLDSDTVDYSVLEVQHGDERPCPFSFMTERIDNRQVPCWITYTNEKIHNLLLDAIDAGRAPLYSGQIQSTGPRYCPSIEVKVLRFPDRVRHQVFLEPEDEQNRSIYCNGISTSVPEDVQHKMLKLMAGTENARIVHYAYAIEYDYAPPTQLKINLEMRKIPGLFLAGQINGTSGYEEAGGQGLLAGVNAVLSLDGKEPFVLGRDEAYIGVMVDDLMTRGIDEPYRMFTSRAEYRLALRADNADRRLTEKAHKLGLISSERWEKYQRKIADIERLQKVLPSIRYDGVGLDRLLTRPDCDAGKLFEESDEITAMNLSEDVLGAVAIDTKYKGYLDRQLKTVEGYRKLEKQKIPNDMDYSSVSHLRAEAREKLVTFKPHTLGQAGRISGITPADVTVLQIHLKKHL